MAFGYALFLKLKMMKKLLFLPLMIPIKLMGQVGGEDIHPIAQSLSEQYRVSVIKEDTSTLIAMLHPEVKFYPPVGPMLAGSELIAQVIVSFLEKNDVNAWEIEILKTEQMGDTIMEFGTFQIEENASSISERKYLNIWVPLKGEYKLFYRGWSPLE